MTLRQRHGEKHHGILRTRLRDEHTSPGATEMKRPCRVRWGKAMNKI